MEEFEASASSKKTKTIYISTVFGIAMVLLMVGLLGLILVYAKNISSYVKENIVLNIFVDDAAHESDVLQLQKQLDGNVMVKQTQYVSKELAARNLQKDLGEDFVKFLGYNPLSQSVDVYLKADYANNKDIEKFKAELLKNPLIKEVKYQQSLVDQMNQNVTTISLIILTFAGIFVVLSVALINNTIRLAIYSQRFLIKSMQLVGATKGFIRKPFLLYGIWHGLLGGLIAIILLIGTLYVAYDNVPDLVFLQNYTEFGIVFLVVVGLGIFISGFSTFLAVNKFLRLKIYDLYR
ncbi:MULTISPECIES: cell division protein FtsX [Mucilaginibacter]|jgi:cell division transport system permease protein|uniref:Cell division protein FtsX n=2 Tax=Mucilaginibacter TaxID=423349 RepID=A0AAE6ML81_9SPHI|nr:MULTISPECIES: permease-like cell division protein FtsX [Mucilaginibacter]QEM07505.1 FtsX-like permease family protein [Mucilaginibacter rubeus]QEM19959.1 FtsX-like permease family protein [Mucilaginibacter gossypii]QTE35024.1 permease-like cell division protein FtsX [Mucilaginibacter gossypii]QTE43333.1 FtsX-like permease family protein [Mucilaginibacter rubeus]QTE49933.1 FtsX-like permease family protein [Mucilaginibacter rubeus]